MTRTESRISAPVSEGLTRARASFDAGRGFLAVASIGIPTRETVAALREDLDLWAAADRDPQHYDPVIERTRASFGRLVGLAPDRIAIGSQTSVQASLVAASVPSGAEVVIVHGDFSSIVYPFLQRDDISVRTVPLSELAASIGPSTWMAVFSHVQSSTGEVADIDAITAAAARTGAFTFCDVTQSAGVHPVDAALFDVTVCHAYKWLCSPRGVAFLCVAERIQGMLRPIQAGWYAGADVWQSCYGPAMLLADDARRFDVSPAWPAWVGADPAIRMFADLDLDEVWAYTSGLGNALCDELGIDRQDRPIVTWPDPEGADLQKLIAAGIRASGRAGRLRAAFHIWNDLEDVDLVRRALR
jgi:selenocysteine lyase/cysteine desulfurase